MDRNYCVNQVYRDIRSDRQFRLLWVDPSTAGSYIYWLDGKPSVPKMLGLQELELGVQQGWIAEDQDPFVLHGNASEKDKQFRDAIWNKMRDALQDEPGIYDRNIRADHLRRIEQESGERVSNLYRHLSRYWERGKTPDAFLPGYKASGGRGKVRVGRARVLKGAFPARQLKFVLAWTEIHRDELMQDWELAKDNLPLIKIAPLM